MTGEVAKTVINKILKVVFGRYIPKINIEMLSRIEEARKIQIRAGGERKECTNNITQTPPEIE